MYELVFISTYQREEVIELLINSIIANNKSIKLLLIIINQSDIIKYPIKDSGFCKIIIINHKEKTSLSNARNIGIKYIIENKIVFNHIMFPDDDSSFDNSFFINYPQIVQINKSYLINVFCNNSPKFYKAIHFKDQQILGKKDYYAAMSVNMVIDYNTFINTGLFDENFGVGAKYGSGEDSDYYFRCSKHTSFNYIKALYNYHPDPNLKYKKMHFSDLNNKFLNYGKGMIFVLCKHKKLSNALFLCFKALGGSFVKLIHLNFRLSLVYFLAFFSRSYFFLSYLIKCKNKT